MGVSDHHAQLRRNGRRCNREHAGGVWLLGPACVLLLPMPPHPTSSVDELLARVHVHPAVLVAGRVVPVGSGRWPRVLRAHLAFGVLLRPCARVVRV